MWLSGQSAMNTSGHATTATNLYYPISISGDGTRLYVAEFNNWRVLIWNTIPTAWDTPASVVLGEPNMTTGLGGTSASAMQAASGVFSDGTRVYVSDFGDNRVLSLELEIHHEWHLREPRSRSAGFQRL